jgi:hypothetical protein
VLMLCLVAGLIACENLPDRRSPLPQPTPVAEPPPPPPPQSPSPVRIGLGSTEGHYSGAWLLYEFIATSRGTLVVRLDHSTASGNLLLLILDDARYSQPYSSIVGRVPVEPDQRVSIKVDIFGSDHGIFDDKFVLTLTLE